MSETKLLMFAGAAMFIVSALCALLLYCVNAGAAWVMLGATIAGIVVYVAICMFGKKSVTGE